MLNQAIKGRFKEAIKQLTEEYGYAKHILIGFLAGISSNQGSFLSAIKVNFCESKILILFANGSTGLMKVTTP